MLLLLPISSFLLIHDKPQIYLVLALKVFFKLVLISLSEVRYPSVLFIKLEFFLTNKDPKSPNEI